MRPIFPQDSLLEPFKYFGVFVDCTSLVQPRRGSTFHVNFRAFVQSSKNKTDTALRKLIPESSEISLSWALCKDGLGQNEIYQACISKSESNPWSSLFSLGSMVPNNQAKSLERKKRKVSSFTIIRSELKREPNSDMQVFFCPTPLTRHTAGRGGGIFNIGFILCLGHRVLPFLIPGVVVVLSILRPGQLNRVRSRTVQAIGACKRCSPARPTARACAARGR